MGFVGMNVRQFGLAPLPGLRQPGAPKALLEDKSLSQNLSGVINGRPTPSVVPVPEARLVPQAETLQGFRLQTLISRTEVATYEVRSTDIELGIENGSTHRKNTNHIPEVLRPIPEYELIDSWIRTPSTNLKQIKQRQELVASLKGRDDLDQIIQLKNTCYDVLRGVYNLYQPIAVEGDFKMPALTAYKDEQYSQMVEHQVMQALDQVEKGRKAVADLTATLTASDDPYILCIAQELAQIAQAVQKLNRKYFLGDDTSQKTAFTVANQINRFTVSFGLFVEFSGIAKRDEYSQASFDRDKPKEFKSGWSFTRNKLGQKAPQFSGKEDSNDQVANDSPRDSAVTVYTGSNMSGKSFELKKQFYMQLLAQSFGWVPAESGNFGIYDSFHYLDRAATDHSHNLSAFGREVTDWNQSIEGFGSRPFLCCDEGFSTTSPVDQYRLLTAVDMFLRQRGARVYYATHNEIFIEQSVGDDEVGIYRLRTELHDDHKVTYHYELEDQPGDSMALAVAADMGFPNDLLERAQSFLDGVLADIGQAKRRIPTPIERYSQAEREELKATKRSPMSIMFGNHQDPSLFRSFSEDPDFRAGRWGPALHINVAANVGSIFLGRDKWNLDHLHAEMLRQLLVDGVSLGSKDCMERQRSFEALAKHDGLADFVKAESRVLPLLDYFWCVKSSASELLSFNIAVNPYYGRGMASSVDSADLFLCYMDLNRKLLGEDFTLEDQYQRVISLGELQDRIEQRNRQRSLDEIITIQQAEEDQEITDEISLSLWQRVMDKFGHEPDPNKWQGKITRARVRAYSSWYSDNWYKIPDRDIGDDSPRKLASQVLGSYTSNHAILLGRVEDIRSGVAQIAQRMGFAVPEQIFIEQLEVLAQKLEEAKDDLGDDYEELYEDLQHFLALLNDAQEKIHIGRAERARVTLKAVSDAREKLLNEMNEASINLPSRSIFESDISIVRDELKTIVDHMIKANQRYSSDEMPETLKFAIALSFMIESTDSVDDLVQSLRAVDSVHTHQMAHSLEKQLKGFAAVDEIDRFSWHRKKDDDVTPELARSTWKADRERLILLCGEEHAAKIDDELERGEMTLYNELVGSVRLASGPPLIAMMSRIYQNTVQELAQKVAEIRKRKAVLAAKYPRGLKNHYHVDYAYTISRYYESYQSNPDLVDVRIDDETLNHLINTWGWYTGNRWGDYSYHRRWRNRDESGETQAQILADFIANVVVESDIIEEIQAVCSAMDDIGAAAEAIRAEYDINFTRKDHHEYGYGYDIVRDDKAHEQTERGNLRYLEKAIEQRYSSAVYNVIKYDNYSSGIDRSRPSHRLVREVARAGAFFVAGRMIRAENQARVTFNDTGEVHLKDAWSLFAPKHDQIVSDVRFDRDELLKLINGANMSGKTFWLKKAVMAILWALNTGHAPATAATLPIFDSVVYLDRVRAKSDKNLSAFGNEIQFWLDYLKLLEEQDHVLAISKLDEIFSTTSPRYQAALTYAIATYAMQKGQAVSLATHNHRVIDRLTEDYPGRAVPYHFSWHSEPGDNGETFVPDYALTQGHVGSNAIEVARTLGLHPDILSRVPELQL